MTTEDWAVEGWRKEQQDDNGLGLIYEQHIQIPGRL